MRVRQHANVVSFKCPGCGDTHSVPFEGIPDRNWSWNRSLESPTIDPSIDVKAGHYASAWKPGDACWCDQDYDFKCYRCHSVVTDGRIFFCTDSTHALAGQTVDLPDFSLDGAE